MSSPIKKSNAWVTHVKAYQAEHGCTYAVALKESKATYKKDNDDKTEIIVTPPPSPEPEPEPKKVLKERKPRKPKVTKEEETESS
jgi:hypothetical protein